MNTIASILPGVTIMPAIDCSNLTEARTASGHFLMLEKGPEVCGNIEDWLARVR